MVVHGDCIKAMRGMDACSVDAIVTDPPYGLGFMGRKWDALPPGVEWAAECLRVLKPGGHLLAFGGTRTYHRLACAIEDADFEIRDCIAWLYGSGFPKSHNLKGDRDGWGTALKPAHEPIVVARKPLAGTVAATVLAHGTGALNVNGCRIGTSNDVPASPGASSGAFPSGGWTGERVGAAGLDPNVGRWPANVALDPEAAAMLDEQTGERPSSGIYNPDRSNRGRTGVAFVPNRGPESMYADSGGASRFFYCAKASSAERSAGLDGFEAKPAGSGDERPGGSMHERYGDTNGSGRTPQSRNVHPTVKPIDLMRWLVRLVTPPNGLVLDPFTGSGTTGCAAVLEGFRFIGIEREDEYAAIAEARIAHWSARPQQLQIAA